MVMLSDSKPNLEEAMPVALDDVRATNVTPLAATEESHESPDSLLLFASEGTTNASTDVVRPVAVTPPPRPSTGPPVPVAIIDDRATREALRKLAEYSDTLTKLQALCASIEHRLEKAEETLQRAERVFAADALQELPARIDARLAGAEESVGRRLHELSTRIDARLVESEQVVHAIERSVASESLERQTAIEKLLRHISERLEQTEEIVRRSEDVIAVRAVREVSACIDARVTGADEVVRRLEQVIARRAREESPPLQPLHVDIDRRVSEPSPWLVPPGSQRIVKGLAAASVLVFAAIFVLFMRVPIAGEPEPVPRSVDGEVPVRDALVDVPASPAPVPAATSPAAPVPTPPPTATPTPVQRPTPAPTATRRRPAVTVPVDDDVAPLSYVGDLSITSTPVGARVSINGRAAGVTPLVLRERQAGSVAVQIAGEGFERWSASVQVRAGETTNVVATLRRVQ